VEKGHVVFYGAKSWPLIQLGKIPTFSSKLPSLLEKVVVEGLVGLVTLGWRRGCCGVNRPKKTILGCS